MTTRHHRAERTDAAPGPIGERTSSPSSMPPPIRRRRCAARPRSIRAMPAISSRLIRRRSSARSARASSGSASPSAPNGRVTAVERLSATSDAFWRATQRQALSRWRFRPATLDGRPVEGIKVMTVTFRIQDA